MAETVQSTSQSLPPYVKGLAEALLEPLKRENESSYNEEVASALATLLSNWHNVEEDGGLCVEWAASEENTKRVQSLLKSGIACESTNFDPEGSPRYFPTVAPFVIDQTESGKIRIYPQRTFMQEAFLGYHIAEILKVSPIATNVKKKTEKKSANGTFRLSPDQEEAIQKSSSRRLSIISGGPGTGKTTSVVRILEGLLAANPNALVYVTAPTGKAKSRIQKSIEDSLKDHKESLPLTSQCMENKKLLPNTIHMWLATPTANGKRPSKNNPLECDILVIDEASMMDSEIASNLFDAIDPKKTSVIVLGDMHQLAAVGPGSVYADLSDPTGPLKDYLSILKTNHRFDAEKGIGKLATAINEEIPGQIASEKIKKIEQIFDEVEDENKEIVFEDADPEEATGLSKPAEECLDAHIRQYAKAIKTYLLEKGDPTKDDLKDLWEAFISFRAIAAQRHGPMSVEAINNFCSEKLKRLLNIPDSEKDFPGKVLIVRHNDRSLNVANGDDGFIYKEPEDGTWKFYAGSTEVIVPLNLLTDYDEAFAITIHQSQGSGYKEVAVFLPDVNSENSGNLATRELLYTAITRAEEKCIIFGSRESLEKCVVTKTRRTGGLETRLKEFLAPVVIQEIEAEQLSLAL